MDTILGIPKFRFGNEIEIAGLILQGHGHTFALLFDKVVDEKITDIKKLSHEEWKELLYQLDTLEIEVLDPTNKNEKVIVRKSQRSVELDTNWNVFRRDGFACRYCGSNKTPCTIDHVVTWESLGATVEDNLLTSCRKCNKTRGNMLFDDWLESDYYKKVMSLNRDIHGAIINWYQNIDAGIKAKQVQLRNTKRSR